MTGAPLLCVVLNDTGLISLGIIVSQREKPPSAELSWTLHTWLILLCSVHLRKGSFCSWSPDGSGSWAQVGTCRCLSPSLLAIQQRELRGHVDSLYTIAQAEVLPEAQGFVTQLLHFRFLLGSRNVIAVFHAPKNYPYMMKSVSGFAWTTDWSKHF